MEDSGYFFRPFSEFRLSHSGSLAAAAAAAAAAASDNVVAANPSFTSDFASSSSSSSNISGNTSSGGTGTLLAPDDLFSLSFSDLRSSPRYSYFRYGFTGEADFEEFKKELKDFRRLKRETRRAVGGLAFGGNTDDDDNDDAADHKEDHLFLRSGAAITEQRPSNQSAGIFVTSLPNHDSSESDDELASGLRSCSRSVCRVKASYCDDGSEVAVAPVHATRTNKSGEGARGDRQPSLSAVTVSEAAEAKVAVGDRKNDEKEKKKGRHGQLVQRADGPRKHRGGMEKRREGVADGGRAEAYHSRRPGSEPSSRATCVASDGAAGTGDAATGGGGGGVKLPRPSSDGDRPRGGTAHVNLRPHGLDSPGRDAHGKRNGVYFDDHNVFTDEPSPLRLSAWRLLGPGNNKGVGALGQTHLSSVSENEQDPSCKPVEKCRRVVGTETYTCDSLPFSIESSETVSEGHLEQSLADTPVTHRGDLKKGEAVDKGSKGAHRRRVSFRETPERITLQNYGLSDSVHCADLVDTQNQTSDHKVSHNNGLQSFNVNCRHPDNNTLPAKSLLQHDGACLNSTTPSCDFASPGYKAPLSDSPRSGRYFSDSDSEDAAFLGGGGRVKRVAGEEGDGQHPPLVVHIPVRLVDVPVSRQHSVTQHHRHRDLNNHPAADGRGRNISAVSCLSGESERCSERDCTKRGFDLSARHDCEGSADKPGRYDTAGRYDTPVSQSAVRERKSDPVVAVCVGDKGRPGRPYYSGGHDLGQSGDAQTADLSSCNPFTGPDSLKWLPPRGVTVIIPVRVEKSRATLGSETSVGKSQNSDESAPLSVRIRGDDTADGRDITDNHTKGVSNRIDQPREDVIVRRRSGESERVKESRSGEINSNRTTVDKNLFCSRTREESGGKKTATNGSSFIPNRASLLENLKRLSGCARPRSGRGLDPFMEFFNGDEHFQEFERVFATIGNRRQSREMGRPGSTGSWRQGGASIREDPFDEHHDGDDDPLEVLHIDETFLDFFDKDEDFMEFERELERVKANRRSRLLLDSLGGNSSTSARRGSAHGCDIFSDVASFCDRSLSRQGKVGGPSTSPKVQRRLTAAQNADSELWNSAEEWGLVLDKLKRNSRLFCDQVCAAEQSHDCDSDQPRGLTCSVGDDLPGESVVMRKKDRKASPSSSFGPDVNRSDSTACSAVRNKDFSSYPGPSGRSIKEARSYTGLPSASSCSSLASAAALCPRSRDCQYTCHYHCVPSVTLDCTTVSPGSGEGPVATPTDLPSPSATLETSLIDRRTVVTQRSPHKQQQQQQQQLSSTNSGLHSFINSQRRAASSNVSGVDTYSSRNVISSSSVDSPHRLSQTALEYSHQSAAVTSESTVDGLGDRDLNQNAKSVENETSVLLKKNLEDVCDAANEKDETDSGYRSGTIPDDKLPKHPSEATLGRTELRRKIQAFNHYVPKANLEMVEGGESFQGFLRVTLNLIRPITMELGARPPSIYELLTKEHIVEQSTQHIAFYMPRDTVKSIHITCKTTTKEVIVGLLKKFHILDHPRKFALYEQEFNDKNKLVKLRRLTDKDFPLVAMLGWEPERIKFYRLVMQENETGEIVWENFSTPELKNFMIVLDREESEAVAQLQYKYRVMKRIIVQRMKELRSERQAQKDSAA